MAGHVCELANKQDDSATLQSVCSMHRWPPLQRRRNEICWRIVTCMLSNCSEMLVLGKNWTTWYSMVSNSARTIHHKIDQGLWQTPESIDFIYSSYLWIQTILSCWKYCQTMQTGTVSRLWLRRRSWRFKIHFWRNIVRFWKSYVCSKSWMCKKQTAVSHNSTESEIISLDIGLRLDGLPALELWDLFVSVLGNVSRFWDRSGKPESDDHKHHKSHNKINVMQDIDAVPSNVQSARQEVLLPVFEDNEAVIKMIIKGRSPTMRHVCRTHRVALDWLFDRINLDSKIQIKYIDTKNRIADILTKGNFTRDEWNHLLNLFNISHFSSTAYTAAMAKRAQQGSGEERVTAQSRPMMNLTARMPSVVSSSTSLNPGRTSYG